MQRKPTSINPLIGLHRRMGSLCQIFIQFQIPWYCVYCVEGFSLLANSIHPRKRLYKTLYWFTCPVSVFVALVGFPSVLRKFYQSTARLIACMITLLKSIVSISQSFSLARDPTTTFWVLGGGPGPPHAMESSSRSDTSRKQWHCALMITMKMKDNLSLIT